MAEENSDVQIRYNGQDILVSKKVADFLERDRKKMAALQRSDRRHLIKVNPFERMDIEMDIASPVEYHVIKNLFLEKLQETVSELTDDEKLLIKYRFRYEMTLKRIGKKFGISKPAVHVRLEKLVEKLRNSVLA